MKKEEEESLPWETCSRKQSFLKVCGCSEKNVHFRIKRSLETQLPAVLSLASHRMPQNLGFFICKIEIEITSTQVILIKGEWYI